jgi:hypothetical protein
MIMLKVQEVVFSARKVGSARRKGGLVIMVRDRNHLEATNKKCGTNYLQREALV